MTLARDGSARRPRVSPMLSAPTAPTAPPARAGPPVLTGASRLSEALALHPSVLELVVGLAPADLSRLRNPLLRRLVTRRMTLARVAQLGGLSLTRLLAEIRAVAHLQPAPARLAGEPEWTRAPRLQVVDIEEHSEKLEMDPVQLLMFVLRRVVHGEVVLFKHPFEPQPLYEIWRKMGIEFHARPVGPDEWWIFLRRRPAGERPVG